MQSIWTGWLACPVCKFLMMIFVPNCPGNVQTPQRMGLRITHATIDEYIGLKKGLSFLAGGVGWHQSNDRNAIIRYQEVMKQNAPLKTAKPGYNMLQPQCKMQQVMLALWSSSTVPNLKIHLGNLPSRELTYPQKIAFWRWFSFSQGGIC